MDSMRSRSNSLFRFASQKALMSLASVEESAFENSLETKPIPVMEPKDYDGQESLDEAIALELDICAKRLAGGSASQIGYPTNHDATVDYTPLNKLQTYKINNVGDPMQHTNNKCHAHDFEVGVLQWFAKLWEIEPEEMWGYVSTGGTESNIQGIFTGRETLPEGILYTSADSHFSVFKAARLLRMETIVLDTQGNGEMDYSNLRQQLRENKDRPAILSLNIGTTMRGGMDDPEQAIAVLLEEGFSENRFYIHLDGALSSIMLPFLEGAPKVSFRLPIGSVSMSGHKFLGVPYPCGVIITRRKYLDVLATDIEYVFMKDVTLTCSRNGHASVNLWFLLSHKGYAGIRKEALYCVDLAEKLRDMLADEGIPVWLNPHSITVVFERPPDDDFVREWQLACQGDVSHVIVMPHLTHVTLMTFVDQLVECRNEAAAAAAAAVAKRQLGRATLGSGYSMRLRQLDPEMESKVSGALKDFQRTTSKCQEAW